ncbi:MAG: hypothetical protein P1U67_13885 [Alcanivoracaceae bacterium]|nr:hypothetical protein [Alcanivoracaceae bacterium]
MRSQTYANKLPVLLALAWLCAQTLLAWHAPSHISDLSRSDFEKSTSHYSSNQSASQDCGFGVNGHGVATVGQLPAPVFVSSSSCHTAIPAALHTSSDIRVAQARGPPALI